MDNKIICIVGPSGAGKTYMSHYMKKVAGIPYVVSCTTRPMRSGEIDGVDHWFVTPRDFEMDYLKNNVLAFTTFGDHKYWSRKSDVDAEPIISYVIDEDGLINLKENHGTEYELIPVYVDMPEIKRIKNGVRLERIKRDENRLKLPLEYYSCTIMNDGPIEMFNKKIMEVINGVGK